MKTIGIDIAGTNNTWVAELEFDNITYKVTTKLPKPMKLEEIVEDIISDHDIHAVVIDAPLSYSISDENGFRNCEIDLRNKLSKNGYKREYIASSNSLNSVTSRGRQLAEELRYKNYNGVILETIPRFCLAQLASANSTRSALKDAVIRYKQLKYKVNNIEHSNTEYPTQRERLWNSWLKEYCIFNSTLPDFSTKNSDGIIDSLVCATIGFLYTASPDKIKLFEHTPKKDRRGYVEGIHVINDKFLNV